MRIVACFLLLLTLALRLDAAGRAPMTSGLSPDAAQIKAFALETFILLSDFQVCLSSLNERFVSLKGEGFATDQVVIKYTQGAKDPGYQAAMALRARIDAVLKAPGSAENSDLKTIQRSCLYVSSGYWAVPKLKTVSSAIAENYLKTNQKSTAEYMSRLSGIGFQYGITLALGSKFQSPSITQGLAQLAKARTMLQSEGKGASFGDK